MLLFVAREQFRLTFLEVYLFRSVFFGVVKSWQAPNGQFQLGSDAFHLSVFQVWFIRRKKPWGAHNEHENGPTRFPLVLQRDNIRSRPITSNRT